MTLKDLLKLKQLEKKVTQGKWYKNKKYQGRDPVCRMYEFAVYSKIGGSHLEKNDAEFIASFRNHAKELIALAEEAIASRGVIEDLRIIKVDGVTLESERARAHLDKFVKDNK